MTQCANVFGLDPPGLGSPAAESFGAGHARMGKSQGSGGKADVLAFWRAVELFSPQDVPKLSAENCVYKLEKSENSTPLPWKNDKYIGDEQAWRHSVFLGVFSLDDAYADLREALNDRSEDDNGDPQRAGDSALAAFTVAEDGRVILGSQTLSSCAWAVNRAFAGGAGSRQWLNGFESASRDFAFQFEKLVAAVRDDEPEEIQQEEHPVSAVLNFGLLGDIRELLAQLLTVEGPEGSKVIRDAVEIRVQSYQGGEASRYRAAERDFLNSFIARDLRTVARKVDDKAYGPALGRYLSRAKDIKAEVEAESFGRVDVERDLRSVRELLAPEHVPLGRWPRSVSEPADLGQQLAVNVSVHGELSRDGSGGLLAVNGPPGTGKTTILRDVIAALVVCRAQRLATLGNPEDAFEEEPITFYVDSQKRTVRRLKARFTGFEMVLACATNAAAENVSVEIPLAEAIAPEWREQVDYFTDIATNMLDSKQRADAGDTPSEAWAMVAARLGSISRCEAFATAFWFGQRTNGGGSTDSDAGDGVRAGASGTQDTQLGLTHILKNYKPAPGDSDWEDARKDFSAVLERVEDARAERQKDARLFTELEASEHDLEKHTSQLPQAQANLQDAKDEFTRKQEDLTRRKDERKRSAKEHEKHQAAPPRLLKVLLSLGRARREWQTRDHELTDHLSAAKQKLAKAETGLEDAGRDVTSATKEVKRHKDEQDRARERIEQFTKDITDARKRWKTMSPGPIFPDEQWADPLHRAGRELRAPWIDEDWAPPAPSSSSPRCAYTRHSSSPRPARCDRAWASRSTSPRTAHTPTYH